MSNVRFDHAKAGFAAKLYAFVQSKQADTPYASSADEAFTKIAALDPTGDKEGHPNQYQNLNWICQRILEEQPRLQDLYKIKNDLTLFQRNKAKLPKEQQSIGAHTLKSMSHAMFPYISQLNKPTNKEAYEKERAIAMKGTQVLYDGPEGKILLPHTKAASQFWGRNTKWCISATESDNLFANYYSKKTPVMMFLPKGTQEKFAFCAPDGAVRNALDEAMEDTTPSLTRLLTAALPSEQWTTATRNIPADLMPSFFVYLPQVYHSLLDTKVNLSGAVSPASMVSGAISYMSERHEDGYYRYLTDDRHHQVARFMGHRDLMLALLGDGVSDEARAELDDILDKDRIHRRAIDLLMAPFFAAVNLQGNKQDFLDKLSASMLSVDEYIDRLRNCGYDGEAAISDLAKNLYQLYKKLPEDFWQDPEFTYKTILYAKPFPAMIMDNMPAKVFEDPRVIAACVDFLGLSNCDSIFLEGMAPSAVLMKDYEGRPLAEYLLDRAYDPDLIVEGPLQMAENAYFSLSDTPPEILAKLVARIEADYPEGLQYPGQLQRVLEFENCDLTHLLEETIARHPEFFEDIPPERHTERMAVLAVTHDPELIIETADRLIGSNPNAFRPAFNKLGQDNPVREARAHYFTDAGTDSEAPAPPPPQ